MGAVSTLAIERALFCVSLQTSHSGLILLTDQVGTWFLPVRINRVSNHKNLLMQPKTLHFAQIEIPAQAFSSRSSVARWELASSPR